MDYETMGRRLARLRAARGLKQETMAKRLDMTRNNYQNYETGRTRMPVMQLGAIAAALRMSRLALLEYLGLVDAAEPNLDDFIRTEAPHLFLLDDAEATPPLGGWRSRGRLSSERGDTSRPARPDTFRPQEATAPLGPGPDAIAPGSRYSRVA